MSAPTMSRLSLSVTCPLAACTGTSGDPAVPGLEPSPVAQAEGLLLVACLADDFLVAGRHLVSGHESPFGDEDTVFVSFPAR
jgi:hypothetical protein